MRKANKIYSRIFANENLANVGYTGKVQVRCPFHDDNSASAGVNPKDGFFHCFTCSVTYKNIDEFLSAYHGVSIAKARKIEGMLSDNVDTIEELPKGLDKDARIKVSDTLGVRQKTIIQMNLFSTGRKHELFAMPVIMNGMLLDYRSYAPGQSLKVLGAKGAKTGLIVGFDAWKESKKKITLIVAGEKDLLKAVDEGFNAISITGGELALPRLFKGHFKDKKVVIFYDNDDAGKEGANALAKFIHEAGAKEVRNITHHHTWMEDKEDLYDFFDKYGKDRDDLIDIIKNTPPMTKADFKKLSKEKTPFVTLLEAKRGENRDMVMQSDVQVSSVSPISWSVPKLIDVLVLAMEGDQKKWNVVGTVEIDEYNINKILLLIDNEDKIHAQLRKMVKWKDREYQLTGKDSFPHKFDIKEHYTVHCATVTDFLNEDVISRKETNKETGGNEELEIFTIENKLKNSESYNVHYKVIPHPKRNNKLVGLVVKPPTSAMSDINDFVLDDATKKVLSRFKDETIDTLFKEFKEFVGNFVIKDLFLAVNLTFHSPLEFMYKGKKVRGTIYASIIGESRTGKSASAQGAVKKYRLGKVINAKLATEAAVIGGSVQGEGGWRLASGVIPRNHRGLVVLEELHGIKDDYYHKNMTEVKSSGMTKIERSGMSLNVPSVVRLIEISNQKSKDGRTKKIEAYPNGIKLVRELIEAPEDIARQDFFLLVPEPEAYIEPEHIDETLQKFTSKDYRTKVLWAWSRKPEQIKFEEGMLSFIWTTAQELNKDFDSHIKVFGSEAHEKLARLALAFASMLVSTDPTFENIIVKKEHVILAKKWYYTLYDNDLFRLREFAKKSRQYEETDLEATEGLQRIYSNHPDLILFLEETTETTWNELQAVAGLNKIEFNNVLVQLIKGKFIEKQRQDILTTVRFKKTLKNIDKAMNKPIGMVRVKKKKNSPPIPSVELDLEGMF